MNTEMIENYEPMQDHEYDPARRPFDDNRPDPNKKEVRLDQKIEHRPEGSDTVIYCLPRAHSCAGRRCIDLMNYFGNIGGFQQVMDALNE